ncbi:recombinase family protein [Sporosarcina siberiensis]|uniref:Recombinase family protein n=1 Tax=Sporosarcina siberiensis TaxID=1365606 RepID=A0ABW4SDD0_9BACL
MRYGYARVSGNTQDFTEQVRQLEAEGCTEVYREKYTGTQKDRPEFTKLLKILKEGDTLTVTKLDRFARTAEDGITTIKELLGRGVRVHILNMGMADNTPMGRFMITILSGVAEFERDMIVERLAEGKAIARQRPDYREGRPRKFTKKQIDHAMQLLDTHSYTEVERMLDISKATLTRYRRIQKQQAQG